MSTDLLKRARAGKLDPVYIIGSAQPLLAERMVSAILNAAVPPELRGFNHEVIEPHQCTASRIISACQTLPMMAQRRSVLVRDLAVLSAAELDKLKSYIDAPNPSTVLVALSSKLDMRLKFYKNADKKIIHNPKAPKYVDQWIVEEADHQGVVMDRAATRRLADVIGKDLARLALSIDQLALFAGDRPVTADDVDDLIADTRERNVFELLNAIGAGDRTAALAAVGSLCEQRQSPVGVVVMLARHMRSLGLFKIARERGLRTDAELAELLGIKSRNPAWKIKQVRNESQYYSPVNIGRALAAISTADRELKGQTSTVKVLGRELGERVVLDRLVSQIIDLRQTSTRPGPRGRGRQARARR